MPSQLEVSNELVRLSREKFFSTADSVSSCCSNSSDDESDQEPMVRLKYTLRVIPEMNDKFTNILASHILLPHKSNSDKNVIVIPSFLSTRKVRNLIEFLESSQLVFPISDRKSNLVYSHNAFRAEIALRAECMRLYAKIISSSCAVFDAVFPTPLAKHCKRSKFYPEIEYIVYDSSLAPNAFIEPHVDNHSILTGIVMLSEPGVDFIGGKNHFKGGTTGPREYQLQRGDLVLFRGELVSHWISPVESGIRKILQWEFSRI